MREVVAVVGAGTMGSGIAQVCAQAGLPVRLHDPDASALEAGRLRLEDGLERARSRGRIDAETHVHALERLTTTAELEAAVEGATYVIEAALEDRALKERIFGRLDGLTSADVVLATNTSSLTVAACAAATRRPERVIGLHFFNPAPAMRLVEVASTAETSQLTVERTLALAEMLGKTAVRCEDAPGFIVNRVGRPYVIEAVRLLDSRRATVTTIDSALEAAGYPMGPFRLVDLIGLDVDLAIDLALHRAFGEAARFAPPASQAELVEAGRLGRKSGHGYYRYEPGGDARVDDGEAVTSTLRAADIVERLELAMINEAYRLVGEGVSSPPDVDTAMRLGAGHPRGPFERVDDIGLRPLVARLHELHGESEGASRDQYEVAPLLWTVATV